MARLSEDELNELRGAATFVGGLIGSLVGAHSSPSKHVLLSTMGAVVGSQLVSEAVTSLVEVAHAQATNPIEQGAAQHDTLWFCLYTLLSLVCTADSSCCLLSVSASFKASW